MKKIISFAIAALTLLSSLNMVSAAEVPTLTIGSVDASAIEVGGEIAIPIVIDKLPEGSVANIQLNFTFDKTKMAFLYSDIYGLSDDDNDAMRVWDATNTKESRHELVKASWTPIEGDNLTLVNNNGAGSLLYVDTTLKKTFTTAKSLAESDVLVYLYFEKLDGATGTCTVDFSEAKLIDVFSGEQVTYAKSAGQIKVVPGTVTFTAGPTKKVEVAGYFTGDKETDGDNADTTDTTAAIYAQLIPADADTVYTKVNWSVTATEDGTANSAAKTQEYEQTGLDLSGEATYKVGLVIRGLAANVITAVDAALAQ